MRRQVIIGLCFIALAAIGWGLWQARPDTTVLRFSAGSPTGQYFRFAQSVAQLVAHSDLDLRIEVMESAGASQNAARIAAREADLGLVQSDLVLPPRVETIASIFPEVLHLVVSRDSGITNPVDMRGRPIALMPEGSGSNDIFARVMDHYGVALADLDVRFMAPDAAMDALRQGEVDGLSRVIALGNDGVRDLLKTDGLVLVPLDQAEAIQMFTPALSRVIVPRGALRGDPPAPAQDIEAIAVSAIFVAHDAVPPETVRALTELLFESRNALITLDPQTALMERHTSLEQYGFPLHAGARAYFEADRPYFVVEYAEPMAFAVSLVALLASAGWQMKRWTERRRKNRGDEHISTLATAVRELREVADLVALQQIEDRMYQTFEVVIVDLDEDRIDEESLPTFDFAWRTAVDVLARKKQELRRAP